MKKKLFFLFFVFFLVSVNYVYAQSCSSTNDVYFYASFSSDCTTEDTGNHTITNNGAVSSGSGINGNSCDFESGDTDYIYSHSVAGSWVDNGGSYCLWAKFESTPNMQFINLGSNPGGTGATDDYQLIRLTSDFVETENFAVNLNEVVDGTNRNTNTSWAYYCSVWNADGDISLFIDGINISQDSTNTHTLDNVNRFYIGVGEYRTSIVQPFDGLIDEVGVWQRELTETEVQNLYNGGDFCYPLATPPSTPPALLLNTDLVNNTINYNLNNITISFNGTITNNSDFYNCTVYDNLSQLFNESNLNLSQNQNLVYNFSSVEKDFYFNIYCENINASNITGQYKYSVDTIQPYLNLTGVYEGQSFYQNNNINFNATFNDTNLFAYNVTILDDTLTIWDSNQYFKENITTTFESFVLNSTTLTNIGNFTIIIEGWDSHTKNLIKDYKIEDLSNGVEIEDNIKIIGEELKKVTLNKKKDRYTFDFEFDKNEFEQTFNISAKNKLYYIEGSDYKLHFVEFQTGKWIDFETDIPYNYEIQRINSREYKINLNFDEKIKNIYFESIGDLNYNTLNVSYVVITPPTDTELLQSINESVSSINNLTIEIEEGFSMLWIIILFGILLFFAHKTGIPILYGLSTIPLIFGFFKKIVDGVTTQYDMIITMTFITISLFISVISVYLQIMELGKKSKQQKSNGLKRIWN